ncbi:MAG: hypothetical protein CSA10_00365 [Cardiobacteriales bacterium]|nr:MAG: hypothetical protein CSA10_00365 [Cardiobacteriales bacterium]
MEVNIGRANIDGNIFKSLDIDAQSLETIDSWQVMITAQELHGQHYQLRNLLYKSIWRWDDGNMDVGESTAKFIWAKTPFTLNSQSFTLQQLLSGEVIWPRGVGLKLQAKDDILTVITVLNGRHIVDSHLQAKLPLKVIEQWLGAIGIDMPKGASGKFRPNLQLLRTQQGWQLSGDLVLSNFTWQSADAMQAIDKVNMNIGLNLSSQDGKHWQGTMEGAVNQGEMLFTSVYINANDAPIRWQSDIIYTGEHLTLRDFRFDDRMVNVRGMLVLDTRNGRLIKAGIEHLSGDAAKIYERYAKAFLQDTMFNDMTLNGTLFISGEWQKNGWRNINAVLNHVDMIDNQQRFILKDLDGQLGQSVAKQRSYLSIGSAKWYDLPIVGFTVSFDWTKDGVVLCEPFFIPILNGGIQVNSLAPDAEDGYLLNAAILPIDLFEFSKALNWPEFRGKISGNFPEMHWNREGLKLSKPVIIHVFNGVISVDALYIKALLQDIPTAGFNLSIDNLDLGMLTEAFDIAAVQGNIEGIVKDVVLVDWEPTQFSGTLNTDKDNPGRRRISHEAVRYLSSAGGGTAIVSQFVEFLNEFPYEKLGFSATLQNNVLTLTGVEAIDSSSFYLVKGKGLPHLDIIGHQTEIDWPELLSRLIAATKSEKAVIE